MRDNDDGKEVEGIEYEAYGPMAEKRLEATEREVKRRWPATKGVRILHRLGGLEVGDVSVAVAVSSPHRTEAFEACRYVIETIKHDVPIWKKEKMADGSTAWVEGNPLRPGLGGARKRSAGTKRAKSK